jgi:microcystin-dependent protein
MAVIIPNSTDTTGGEEYASLDQAEPDSLDFEIVGNTGASGVLSGCEVTTNGNLTVDVAAGVVVVQGVSYDVSADAALSLPTSPSDTRFDAVVARESGGSVTLAVVQGVESATNPVYPQSMNVFGGSYDGSIHVDFANDVVLAVCLREAAAAVTAPKIVDKRAMLHPTIRWQGTSLPSVATDGSMFFLTNEVTTGVGVIASGTYVRANGAWISLAQNNQYVGMPVGTTIWFNGSSPPAGTLLEDGTGYSTATYADLFAVIGYTYGGSGGTFNVPDTIGSFVRGDTGVNVGNTGGASSVTLVEGNLPSHNHTLNNHTHTLAHTHSIDHNHASASTNSAGSHNHDAPGSDDFLIFQGNSWIPHFNFDAESQGSSSYGAFAHNNYPTQQIYPSTSTTSDGSHSHTLDLPNHTGTSGGASSTTTSAASGNTSSVGSGTAFNILPPYINKLPCIVY